MHITKSKKVCGMVDEFKTSKRVENNEKITRVNAKGWAFQNLDLVFEKNIFARFYYENGETYVKNLEMVDRIDVDNYYGGKKLYIKSGWEFEIESCKIIEIELCLNVDNVVEAIFKWSLREEDEIFDTNPKGDFSYLAIDNFYKNPDYVRDYALQQNFKEHKKYHKGFRTEVSFRPKSIKRRFEQLIGKKIDDWGRYGTNGVFQYCKDDDRLVYHYDKQKYAAIVFLKPDSVPNSGTSLFRSKRNGLMKITDKKSQEKLGCDLTFLHDQTFKDGYYDDSQFELVDVIGNVYNRLIIFDGQIIHAASSYFGNDKFDSRLFQIFFFDAL